MGSFFTPVLGCKAWSPDAPAYSAGPGLPMCEELIYEYEVESVCTGSGGGHQRLTERVLQLHTSSGFNCMHAFHYEAWPGPLSPTSGAITQSCIVC